MNRQIENTCILVPDPIGRAVPVYVDYAIRNDWYGQDADGHRGELRSEVELVASYLLPSDTKRFTDAERAALVAEAEAVFWHRKRHF